MKAVVKYPGSKWSISEWIISFFPQHHSYVEPFFGSGAVLFNKGRSNIETVNDLDGNVVNLFECIREDPEKLARSIYLTPYSRQVYEKAFHEIPEDKFEAALNFYIRLNMGHGFRTNGERLDGRMMYRGGNVLMRRRIGVICQKRLSRQQNGSEGSRLRTGRQ